MCLTTHHDQQRHSWAAFDDAAGLRPFRRCRQSWPTREIGYRIKKHCTDMYIARCDDLRAAAGQGSKRVLERCRWYGFRSAPILAHLYCPHLWAVCFKPLNKGYASMWAHMSPLAHTEAVLMALKGLSVRIFPSWSSSVKVLHDILSLLDCQRSSSEFKFGE